MIRQIARKRAPTLIKKRGFHSFHQIALTQHVARQALCYTLQQGVCSMTTFRISAAARAAGVSRTTLQRAIKSGRLSTTTDAAGGRCIDLSELLRAFGPLQATQQGEGAALLQDAAGRAPPDTLLERSCKTPGTGKRDCWRCWKPSSSPAANWNRNYSSSGVAWPVST